MGIRTDPTCWGSESPPLHQPPGTAAADARRLRQHGGWIPARQGNPGAAKYPVVFRAVEHGASSRLVLASAFPRSQSRSSEGVSGRKIPPLGMQRGELRFHDRGRLDAEASFPQLKFGLNLRWVPGLHFAGAVGTKLVCVSHRQCRTLPKTPSPRGTRLAPAPFPSSGAFSSFPLNPNVTFWGKFYPFFCSEATQAAAAAPWEGCGWLWKARVAPRRPDVAAEEPNQL